MSIASQGLRKAKATAESCLEVGEVQARRHDVHDGHVAPAAADVTQHRLQLRVEAVVQAPLLVHLHDEGQQSQ